MQTRALVLNVATEQICDKPDRTGITVLCESRDKLRPRNEGFIFLPLLVGVWLEKPTVIDSNARETLIAMTCDYKEHKSK